jgi:Mg2+-importing ATPase
VIISRRENPISETVPGDIVSLSAGAQVPTDCRILQSKDLFVDQSALTGESFPSSKEEVEVSATAPLIERTNAIFAGTHVVSGSVTAVVVLTGWNTEFSGLIRRERSPEGRSPLRER